MTKSEEIRRRSLLPVLFIQKLPPPPTVLSAKVNSTLQNLLKNSINRKA